MNLLRIGRGCRVAGLVLIVVAVFLLVGMLTMFPGDVGGFHFVCHERIPYGFRFFNCTFLINYRMIIAESGTPCESACYRRSNSVSANGDSIKLYD